MSPSKASTLLPGDSRKKHALSFILTSLVVLQDGNTIIANAFSLDRVNRVTTPHHHTSPKAWSRTFLRPLPSHHRNKHYTTYTSLAAAAASTTTGTTTAEEVSTVQILMSDTGGGHRASANALRDAFNVLHPDEIECDIVDIYTDYGPFFPYNAYVPMYKIMAEYTFLWEAFYNFGTTPFGMWLNDLCLEIFCFEPFKECMDRPSGSTSKRADMVVSVHPLCQGLPLKILTSLDTNGKSRTEGRTTPFVTVVTDLGSAHPTWFHPGVDKCFVPSDALYDYAKSRHVQPSQLVEYGLPIRKGFWPGMGHGDESKAELRADLGLDESMPTVTLVGGGDGMGGIVEQAKSLGKKLSSNAAAEEGGTNCQMVVICGKNENAERILSSEPWGDGVKVHVKGFVYNMEEYMRASDALVTKAGPGTIAEASICGLPCVLSSFLPGQEEGNIPYVEEAGFGTFKGSPTGIADTVSEWLSKPDLLEEMKESALKAARPSATLDIARDLANILFEHKQGKRS